MSGIRVFDPGTAALSEYPFGTSGTVKSWQPIGTEEAAPLGAGVCEYKGTFDWDLHYDAVYYLLSGSLTVIDDEGEHTVGAGQIMFIPQGSLGHYVSPQGCRLFWAISPGDWERISDFSINDPGA